MRICEWCLFRDLIILCSYLEHGGAQQMEKDIFHPSLFNYIY